ncbi:MAG: helix-turn-helix transcriptional regulator [Chloroflexota bacterium]
MLDKTDHNESPSNVEARPLRDIRNWRRLTMRGLAQHAGVAPSTIYMIEAGRSTPHLSVVRRIAEVLDVDAQAIIEFRLAIRAYGGLR